MRPETELARPYFGSDFIAGSRVEKQHRRRIVVQRLSERWRVATSHLNSQLTEKGLFPMQETWVGDTEPETNEVYRTSFTVSPMPLAHCRADTQLVELPTPKTTNFEFPALVIPRFG